MLVPEPNEDVTFNWIVKNEQTITVLRLWVNDGRPGVARRKGLGSRAFLEWEKPIPTNFKRIELLSMNAEETIFWKTLGFIDQFELRHCDGSYCMVKHINR